MPSRLEMSTEDSFAARPIQGMIKSTRAGKVKHSREDTVEVLLVSDIPGVGLNNSCGLWFRQTWKEKRTVD